MNPAFKLNPPVPAAPAADFRQTLELRQHREKLAEVIWQTLPGVAGAYQLLWAEVDAEQRRRGHGSLALAEALRQMQAHSRAADRPIRQVMALIAQPNVTGRAWLARNGFVHNHTIDDLAPTGEVLVMVRTFV